MPLGGSVHEWKAFLQVGHRLDLAFFSVAVVKLTLRSCVDREIGIQSEKAPRIPAATRHTPCFQSRHQDGHTKLRCRPECTSRGSKS